MKRLIKKSDIYDGFNLKDEYVEVFKNPTDNEIEITKNSDPNKGIRGVISSDGTIYIWPAEISHYTINRNINEKIPVDYFRFAYEPNYTQKPWIFDLKNLGGELTVNEAIEIIKNNINFLSKIGPIDIPFGILTYDNIIEENNLNLYIK